MSLRVLDDATYEDLLKVPDTKVAELVEGELFTSPRPRSKHARVSSLLGGMLFPFDWDGGGPGGWWILDEPELHFGENVLVPELASWRHELEVFANSGGRWTVAAS